MARMMIGDTAIRDRATRADRPPGDVVLELAALFADDDDGLPALERINLKVHAGEIVGIAGVSGNGRRNSSRCCRGSGRWPTAAF
jgi:general nucleoside transport system ATP-binding protein